MDTAAGLLLLLDVPLTWITERSVAEDAAAITPTIGVIAPAKASPAAQESENISAAAAIRFIRCTCVP